MTETTWERTGDWVGADIADSFVMLSVEGGEYLSFNKTAREVWNALEAPAKPTDIVVQLRKQFDVDEDTCLKSVNRTLQTMVERGIIRTAD